MTNRAQIYVHYTGFTTKAQQAFQAAVDIWASLIQSPITIRIDAYWEVLEKGVLGNCGPTNYYRGYDGMPYSNTFYPIALAEKLTGENLNDSVDYEMKASFNSSANWYLGQDGNTPSSKYDFESVVLHEICHGLGFIGSFSVSSGLGSWGWGTDSPFAFDHYVVNSKYQYLLDEDLFPNNSSKLKTQLTSSVLYFTGPLLLAEYGKSVSLYAPTTWNEGSSVYHLSNVYNSGSESLMTYSLNAGKSVHDPGVIALNILNELGWKQLRFVHTPIINTEDVENVEIKTRIESDYTGTIVNPKLFYSIDSADYVGVNLINSSADTAQFSATIPITGNCNVSYYMTATDKYGREFKIPVGAPDDNYHFAIEPDVIPPVIKHYPNTFLMPEQDSVFVSATVRDGFGVDSVWIEYSVGGVPQQPVRLHSVSDNRYELDLDISSYNLQVGDSINYRILAVDKSREQNIGTYPDSGTVCMKVEAIPDFVETIDDNFEAATNNFILQGFEIDQPSGFDNNSLNSPHPYDFAGENNSLNYIAQIRYPVKIISTNHYISFDEIVLVEPGDAGFAYGSDNFYDYVVVEASKDGGKTWLPLEDGWDSRRDPDWLSVYNQSLSGQFSQAAGIPSMYRSHLIDMTASGSFSVDDQILIRFRLYSDPYANGWGWSIDNLKVQTQGLANQQLKMANELKVYPNPVTNNEITIDSKGQKINSISLYNLQGAKVYTTENVESNNRIQLQGNLKGTYIMVINTNEKTEHFKILIE